jgi:hypothetical protein
MLHTFSRPLPPQTQALLRRLADVLPWPLLLMHEDGLLVYANQAGWDVLARARPLRTDRQGRVSPTSPAHRSAFQQALVRAGADSAVQLRLPSRPRARLGRLERLSGDGPPLLLLSLLPALGPGQDPWQAR